MLSVAVDTIAIIREIARNKNIRAVKNIKSFHILSFTLQSYYKIPKITLLTSSKLVISGLLGVIDMIISAMQDYN